MTPTSNRCGGAQLLVVPWRPQLARRWPRIIELLFEYHKRMSRSRDVDPAARLRKTTRGWAEPSPTHCSECGATLGPRKVLVGVVTCLCGRSHRTNFCRACEFTHYTSALGPECLLLAMDERNMRATLRTDDDQASPP